MSEKKPNELLSPSDTQIIDWMEKWMPEVMCRDLGKTMEVRVTYYSFPHPSAAKSITGGTIREAIRMCMIKTGDFNTKGTK